MTTCPYPGHTACQLRDDLERARSIAVALEQENAELLRRVARAIASPWHSSEILRGDAS